MAAVAGLSAAVLACLAGCPPAQAGREGLYVQPLPVQQRQAYPETVTGRFVSLTDFETSVFGLEPGHRQLRHFKITPAGAGAELKYVVNITRTGVGAMEVSLPRGAVLEYRLPAIHDLSDYTLLMMAVYAREIRDDLKVVLTTDRAGWESLPVLLKSGWNDVLIDLQRLKRMPDFEARGVRRLRLWFGASGGAADAVRINLDDIMLIDNRREIGPVPEGMRLVKSGLDYELRTAGRGEPMGIRQCDDGLWRLGADQPLVQLFPRGLALKPDAPVTEDLTAFGRRRVGEVAILEANALRLRLSNTWYFPTSAGQWASLAVRQIRWEHTFYADGREVTDLVVNNAGGQDVSALRVKAPAAAAWSGGGRGAVLEVERFGGSVGRWSFLTAPQGQHRSLYEANYVKPAGVEIRMGRQEACDGDVDADGFDESQGCYHLQAKDGHCRFLLKPGAEGLADAVIRVRGGWKGGVTASSEGLALRDLIRVPDGTVLFLVPGVSTRPRWVEVTGPVSLLEGDTD
ncbi:MAG: hypothetical protein AMJ81_04950 [Phycisphaerae bacterium SM23_33]|nr:MAG: hypothetical protein AMJ81_04950 [Phycisphaerae bacterium SM23_33]